MMRLIAVVMLPMLCLVAIIAWNYGHAARRTIEAQRLDIANNIRIMIDREIDRTVGFLDGLSIAPGLRANNALIVNRVIAMARERGFVTLVLYDLDGQPMVNSIAPFRPLLAERMGLSAIKAGAPHFVTGYVDTVEKPGLYFVSVPVRDGARTVAMMTGGLPPGRLQPLLADAEAPPGWTVSIVDRAGILLARGKEAERYVGVEAWGSIATAARGAATDGLFSESNREGNSIENSFQRSVTSGWVAGVGVPTEIVEAPLWRTAMIMTVIGIVLTLASLMLAFAIASHFSRAVRRLGIAAVAIASGDAVRMPDSNIAELRDVSLSMEVTGEVARRAKKP
jgi:hypothetical protein